jgi:hypothetical protein
MRRRDKDERDAQQAIVDEHMAALVDYGHDSLGCSHGWRASAELPPPL